MKGFRTIDRNSKWNSLIKELKKAHKAYVTIGIHESAEPYPSGESVADVAFYHEYGTIYIPSRSFFRSTLSAKDSEIKSRISSLTNRLLALQISAQKALREIGVYVMNQIHSTIRTRGSNAKVEWEPLSFIRENLPKSRWWKYHSKPLMDTGRLLNSITYEVHI